MKFTLLDLLYSLDNQDSHSTVFILKYLYIRSICTLQSKEESHYIGTSMLLFLIRRKCEYVKSRSLQW